MKRNTLTLLSLAFGTVIANFTMKHIFVPLGIMDEVKYFSMGLVVVAFVGVIGYETVKYKKSKSK